MPGAARAAVGGMIDHALNRGNGRAAVFHKPKRYDALRRAIVEAANRRHGATASCPTTST